jgi:hypothetical protein
MSTNADFRTGTSAAKALSPVPSLVTEHAQAVSDALALFRWVAALALGALILGILVGLAWARTPLPVYLQGG